LQRLPVCHVVLARMMLHLHYYSARGKRACEPHHAGCANFRSYQAECAARMGITPEEIPQPNYAKVPPGWPQSGSTAGPSSSQSQSTALTANQTLLVCRVGGCGRMFLTEVGLNHHTASEHEHQSPDPGPAYGSIGQPAYLQQRVSGGQQVQYPLQPTNPQVGPSNAPLASLSRPEALEALFLCVSPGCDRSFESDRIMKIHLAKAHDVHSTTKHDCSVCGHSFPKRSERDFHQLRCRGRLS
jgi:hypothetical protein